MGESRRHYDGLSLRLTGRTTKTWRPFAALEFDGRFALTWTTGTLHPLRYNTWKAEIGFRVVNLPFFVWHRSGHNSDLVDYYRKDHSWGVAVSFWEF